MASLGIVSRIKAAVNGFRFGGDAGGFASGASDFFGSSGGWIRRLEYDYQREAGAPWENSVYWAALRWIANNYQQAEPCVYKRVKGQPAPVVNHDHPYARLMNDPNPDYDGGTLAWAIVNSLLCAGRCYMMVDTTRVGIPRAMYWIPWWQVVPRWPSDGTRFISHYDYVVNGKVFAVPREQMVDLRMGMNPFNYRIGLSGVAAVLPQICTINESARFMAAITRNPAVFSALFSPEGVVSINPDVQEKLKAQLREYGMGENRGGVIVPTVPLKVTKLAWSPEEMALDTVLKMPEAHICAALGVSTIVLNLTAGERRDTFANKASAIRESYENGVEPLQMLVCRQMRRQLPVLFGPNERPGYDYTMVPCKQQDRNDLAKRLETLAGGPIITVNEARLEYGQERINDPEYDRIRSVPSGKPTEEPEPETGPDPEDDGGADEDEDTSGN